METVDIIQRYEKKIQVIEAELQTFQKRCEQYAAAYEQLQHQVKELLRHRFGRKSERFMADANMQLSLFDTKTPTVTVEKDVLDETVKVASHKRKKRKASHDDLPRRIEIIPVSEADKLCVCGCQKTVIRYETKELLHYEPAVFEIIEQRREVVACPNSCEHAMLSAPVPLHILPKAKVSETFLSFLVVSKLDDRQPLYHLEKQLAQRYSIRPLA